MIKFEKVSRFADVELPLPIRATRAAAGYDFVVAEDIIVPTWTSQLIKITETSSPESIMKEAFTLQDMSLVTGLAKAKPTLVSTGMKCHLKDGYYLELSVRSSTPLKYWLILANGVGIIDADYCDNPDNEGEIFFQLINLSPHPIQLKCGDKIGQGIIKKYETTDDDASQEKKERAGGFGSTTAKQINVELAFNQEQAEDIVRNIRERLYDQMKREGVMFNG